MVFCWFPIFCSVLKVQGWITPAHIHSPGNRDLFAQYHEYAFTNDRNGEEIFTKTPIITLW